MNSALIVQKFGGSSVAKPEQIVNIARKIAELHRSGKKIIAVVSAMGKTTDELVQLALKVSAVPDRRELDMLLSTGERVSMALLSMALKDLNCPSISFTGSQAGVFTDGAHSNAKIIDVKPIRVAEALQNNKVVVLAGFQGVNPVTKEITTLGRGGSDTTAVAMAAHFKADRCEILKDVDGVCSADPKIVTAPVLHQRLPLEALYDMCFWGAKVLHARSVELALREKVNLFVGRSDNFVIGSEIVPLSSGGFEMFENQQVIAVNSHAEVHHAHVTAKDTAEAMALVKELLDGASLPWPQLLATAWDQGTTRFMYTADAETLAALKKSFHQSPRVRAQEKVLASVTATCFGAVGGDLVARMADQLKKRGIAVEKTIVNPMSVSFFIAKDDRETAVQELHTFVKK